MNTVKDMAQLSLLVDDESGTLYGKFLVPVPASSRFGTAFLFVQDSILLANMTIRICQQLHGEAVFVAEGSMADAIIAADADHDGIMPSELFFVITEFVRLHRASGRTVFGIEVQHDIFAALRFQAEHVHVCIGQLEVRCVCSNL